MHRPNAYHTYLFAEGSASLFYSMAGAASMIYMATTVGLNPLQLVLVGTALEGSYFICQLPTGLLADMFGRRLSIIIGFVLIGFGFMLEGLVPRFESILLAQALWGLGAACTDGAMEAWISDEVGEAHAGPAFMRAAQMSQITAVAGTLAGIVLGSVQINLPIVAGGVLISVLGLLLSVVMPEHGFRPRPRGQHASQQVRARLRDSAGMLRRRPALLTILAIGAVFGAFSEGYDRLSTAHMVENFAFPDLLALQPIAWLGGIRIAVMLLSAGALEMVRTRIDTNNHHSVVRALSWLYGILSLAVIAFGLAGSFWPAVAAMMAAALVRRISNPIYLAWVNQRLDSQVRATVISMSAQADALGQIAGGPVVGAIGTLWSLRAALVTAGLMLSPVLLLIRYTGRQHEQPEMIEEAA